MLTCTSAKQAVKNAKAMMVKMVAARTTFFADKPYAPIS